MSVNCAGRHVCEPEFWPTELGQTWRCDVCGADHFAFDVHATYGGDPKNEHQLRHVPAGTLGWTTGNPDKRNDEDEGLFA